MKTLKTCAAAATMVAVSGASQAALIDRGGGMIFDSTRNITWLADMNYARTSGHTGGGVLPDGSGAMTWAAATAWANNLVYGGFDDWRLPTLNPSDTSCSDSFDEGAPYGLQYFGHRCTGGELSGLFVTDLGYNNNGTGLITGDDTAEQIANLALFRNVQSSAYWSGTEYAPDSRDAWGFSTGVGDQLADRKFLALYAVAVRPGDVTASVPEPQTLALALLALGATVVARRRRSR
jgi:hypothetical protein